MKNFFQSRKVCRKCQAFGSSAYEYSCLAFDGGGAERDLAGGFKKESEGTLFFRRFAPRLG